MDTWINGLARQLESLDQASLLRKLETVEPDGPYITVRGRKLLNLSSNDYLGLSTHPALKRAAIQAVEAFGVGAGSSRLVSGTHLHHRQAEARFASFKHAEAALVFPTGYMANLGVVCSLAGPGDLICADKLNHASLHDAGRMSGAELRIFPHLSLSRLEHLLKRHRDTGRVGRPRTSPVAQNAGPPRRLIVTDSVFSMDGDFADLPSLCGLADEYDAILIVDEAHGTGVLGATGAGLCELQGVAERVDVVVSTASKAMGGLGGIVTAREVVIRTLVNRARQFIYTTGSPPWQSACIMAALDVIRDEPERRARLCEISRTLRDRLIQRDLIDASWRQKDAPTPIIPIIVSEPQAALDLSSHLESHGFFAPAIRPPTVAPGSARVRISLRSDFPSDQVDRLVEVVEAFGSRAKLK